MTPDAALDSLAFSVGLRLMGPDARRRLRLTLLLHPDVTTTLNTKATIERLERLDGLLDGCLLPESLQDRLDLARAERERAAAPFDPAFWLARASDLMRAGFNPQQAASLIFEVRGRLDPEPTEHNHIPEMQHDPQSQA